MSMKRSSLLGALVLFLALSGLPSNSAPSPSNTPGKLGSSLLLLAALRQIDAERVPPDAHYHMKESRAHVVLGLRKQPTPSEVAAVRRLGADLNEPGMRTRSGWHGSARVPWQALEALSRLSFVSLVDSVWQPGVWPTLDLSAHAVGATDVWAANYTRYATTNESRVIIANFDTGVDVFHPGLWRPDGGLYDWIDVNGNGVFDSGIDAVDLNKNEVADPGESLLYLKAPVKDYKGAVTNSSGPFVPQLDWLYNDANNNGMRDCEISFGESTPAYGERTFILEDTNGNGAMDVGEKLIALGSSKVAAFLGTGGITRWRGVDLISAAPDTNGHGTAVCGILVGEEPWLRRYVGISPNADLLVADRAANSFTTYIPWAEANGAKIMLYEFGAWTFQFMDGSSPLEQAISAEWDKGITQVVPAGNLANGKKHVYSKSSQGSANYNFIVPSGRGINTVYLTALWTNPDDEVSFTLTNPGGGSLQLKGDCKFYTDTQGNLCWSYGVQQSSKGTRRFDIYISGVTTGTWKLSAAVAGSAIRIHAYISDNIGGWSGGAYFSNPVSSTSTVSWPATADKALVVGSYSTRGIYTSPGAISAFSGKGPKINGSNAISLCAPGNYDVFALCSKDAGNPLGSYKEFSGTSAAAPHVAAACALLLQMDPSLTSEEIAYLLTRTARTDEFTGATPNETWGYGKLDVCSASKGVSSIGLDTCALASMLPDGAPVTLFAKLVTAVSADNTYFYMQESDRSSGIRVLGSGAAELDKVIVSGTMGTVGVERAIMADSVEVIQSNLLPLRPLGMSSRWLGGPEVGRACLRNTGLLITTWGRVINNQIDGFVIDDGSGDTVSVLATAVQSPQSGALVSVTGISSTGLSPDGPIVLVVPRRQSDIVVID